MGRGGEAGLGLSDFASGTLDSSIVAEGVGLMMMMMMMVVMVVVGPPGRRRQPSRKS